MTGPTLTFVNIVADDLERLRDFYASVFDLVEVEALRNEHFRGYAAGGCTIGITDRTAASTLGVEAHPGTDGGRVLLTFDVASDAEVHRRSDDAITRGATLLRAPFETHYGSWQSVLADPEGNVVRVNHFR